jgi:predicted DNA-binding protein
VPTSSYLPNSTNEEEASLPKDLVEELAEMEAIEQELVVMTTPIVTTTPHPDIRIAEPTPVFNPLEAAAVLAETVRQDNIEAAMDKVAETLEPKVSQKISDDDGPADKQILIRSTQRDHERWKLAAEREGKSLSGFIRELVNSMVAEVLDCSHPEEFRQRYPWQETCLKCETRLWQSNETHLQNRR